MRIQALYSIGAICGLLGLVTAIPALKYTGFDENCNVTTVYVTVAPTSSTSTVAQLPSPSLINYGGISKSEADDSAHASVTGFSIHESGSVTISTSTTRLTTTVHQTASITRTVTVSGYTSTEAIEVTYPTPSLLSAVYTLQTIATFTNSMSSADAIMASTSALDMSQVANTAYSSYFYSVVTMEPQSSCSDNLVECPQLSVSNVDPSSSTQDATNSQLAVSTSTPPVVYVIETLTVIPLATVPKFSSSNDQTTIMTVPFSIASTVQVTQVDLASSVPVVATVVYVTGQSITTLSTSHSSGGYTGTGGWNMSTSSGFRHISNSSLASTATGSSPTSAADALSVVFSTFMSSPSPSINFSNSHIFPNISSTLVAEQGFTASHVYSDFSNILGTSSSVVQSLTILSSSLSQTTEIVSTESCCEKTSATPTVNPEQSTIMPMTAVSSSISSAISSSSASSLLNATVWPCYNCSTTPLSLATVTSNISSVVSNLSGFSTSGTSPSSTSTTLSSEDTCTKYMIPSSSTPSSSNPRSTAPTFITLTNGTAISAPGSSTLSSTMSILSGTTTSSTGSASPTPTLCGEYGAFTLNFDDLPVLSTNDNSTAKPEPLFSPYHQFYFSSGWSLAPPPNAPYKPSSSPLMVEFLPNPGFALGYTGAMGNGENELLGCFNFNAINMSLGCNSTGPDCDWQFTGLRYNNVTNNTDTITTQMFSTAACPALSNCDLVPVSLDNTFKNLTELRINVTVNGVNKIWWLDDLNLSWFDDSCDAGLCRMEHV